MAIPSSTFTIVPNLLNGSQVLSDPDGTDVPTPTLEPVENLRIAATSHEQRSLSWVYTPDNHDGFEVEEKQDGEADFRQIAVLGPTLREYTTNANLPNATVVTHRVRATSTGGIVSDWEEVTGTTNAAPGTGDGTDLTQASFYDNFSSYAEGTLLTKNNSVYSSTVPSSGVSRASVISEGAYPGALRSMHCDTPISSPGAKENSLTEWGYTIETSSAFPRMVQGSEYWVRQAVFFPLWYNPEVPAGGLKSWRFGRINPSASPTNKGYIDLSLKRISGDSSRFQYRLKAEHSHPVARDLGFALPKGRWVMVEVYVKMDTTESALGGEGKVKIWHDGALVTDESLRTMGPNEYMQRFIMHGVWNKPGPVINQWSKYCHITIMVNGTTTNGTRINQTGAMDRDESGFPFIGMATL